MSKLKLACWVVGTIMFLSVIYFQLSKPTSLQEDWENVNSKMAVTLQLDTITETSNKALEEAPNKTPKEAPNKAPNKAPRHMESLDVAQDPTGTQKSLVSEWININTATLEQLDVLPGIGPSKAKAIIDYRTKYGDFRTLEQLMEVKGIGPKIFAKMKEKITLKPQL